MTIFRRLAVATLASSTMKTRFVLIDSCRSRFLLLLLLSWCCVALGTVPTVQITTNNIHSLVTQWRKNPAQVIEQVGHVRDWDVSNVTDMRNLFGFEDRFNEDISAWNVRAVTDFRSMFWSCSSYNGNLGNWDTSGAVLMDCMFCDAVKFEGQGLENWSNKLGNVTSMVRMFSGTNLQTDLSSWNVARVTRFREMFSNTPQYEQSICWDSLNKSAYSQVDGMFYESAACFDKECTPKVVLINTACSSATSFTTMGVLTLAGVLALVAFL